MKAFHSAEFCLQTTGFAREKGTKSQTRVLPIPGPLVTVLKNYKAKWVSNPEGFLFVTRNGRPPSQQGVEYQLWTIGHFMCFLTPACPASWR